MPLTLSIIIPEILNSFNIFGPDLIFTITSSFLPLLKMTTGFEHFIPQVKSQLELFPLILKALLDQWMMDARDERWCELYHVFPKSRTSFENSSRNFFSIFKWMVYFLYNYINICLIHQSNHNSLSLMSFLLNLCHFFIIFIQLVRKNIGDILIR